MKCIIVLVFVLVIMIAPAVLAEDAVFTNFPGGGAPYCSTGVSPCVAGSNLLMSRDNITGQIEPNYPSNNTIDGCADGKSGTYLVDETWENLTVIEVGSDGIFNPGDTVEVEGWVFCYSNQDRVGFAYANNANTPSWTVINTTLCPGNGFNSFSYQFTLDSIPGNHSVRGILHWNHNITSGCNANAGYDERDDLVFYVADTTPPDISFGGGTPLSGSTQAEDSIFVDVSASSTSSISTFIDFDNSLVGWWRMDDVSGSTVYDNSSYGNDGTAQGDAVQTDAGYFGKGFYFDGSGDYVTVAYDDSLNITQNLTVSAWVYSIGFSTTYDWIIQLNENDGYGFFANYVSATSATFRVATGGSFDPNSGTLNTNQWYHLVVTTKALTATTINISTYINGVYEASASGNNIDTNGENLYIGRREVGGQNWNGTIDEVMIFNRSLSAEEIQALYANQTSRYLSHNFTGLAEGIHTFRAHAQNLDGDVAGTGDRDVTVSTSTASVSFVPPTPGDGSSQAEDSIFVNVSASGTSSISTFIDFDNSLVGWWRMDDLNATGDPVDYLGRNNGSAQGDAVQTDAGYLGEGFEFDGTLDYIDIGSPPTSMGLGETYTISAWINMDITPSWQTISAKNSGASTFNWYFVMNGNYLSHSVGPGGANSRCSSPSLPIGIWHHVVAVFNGTNTLLYIQGTECTTYSAQDIQSPQAWDTNYNILIGRNDVWNEYFDGTIDDVMIFNRSLSAEEIQALYANQTSRYLSHNFTGLAEGIHTFRAYAQDTGGNVAGTGERDVTISAAACTPDGCNANCPAGCTHAEDPDCGTPDCSDNCQNGDETDMDCGGSCPACADGDSCLVDSDCLSVFCTPVIDICATPSCSDGFQNGDETGIDCGGSCTTGAETGKCEDTIDNDNDCDVDCADSDCSADPACASPPGGAAPGFEPGLLVVMLAVLFAGGIPVMTRNRK